MSRHAFKSRHDSRRGRKGRWWNDGFGIDVLKKRWTNAMPRFFRVICWASALVSGTALAVNTAIVAGGGVPHAWWSDIYPYLLGVPAGMAFVAKFTQQYSGKPVDYDAHRRAEREGRTVLDSDIDHMHAASADAHEIEPYNDDE